jgi:hypothetical protein
MRYIFLSHTVCDLPAARVVGLRRPRYVRDLMEKLFFKKPYSPDRDVRVFEQIRICTQMRGTNGHWRNHRCPEGEAALVVEGIAASIKLVARVLLVVGYQRCDAAPLSIGVASSPFVREPFMPWRPATAAITCRVPV